MNCYVDCRVCTCHLDDVAKGECPRDIEVEPMDDYEFLMYLNGETNEAHRIHG